MIKRVLGNILCDLDPKVKVKGKKAGICDGVLLTSALVIKSFCSKLGDNCIQNFHLVGIFSDIQPEI